MTIRASLHRSLLLFVTIVNFNHFASGNSDLLPWSNARELLQEVCPYADICGIQHTLLDRFQISCCTDSVGSCAEDCESSDNCCFVKTTERAEDESCLYLRSKKRDMYMAKSSRALEKSYFTVTKIPPGGCVEGHADSCNFRVPSFLPPVFSNKTNKLYLNRNCAICHGVREFIEYESYLICDPLGGSSSVDFAKDLTSFLESQTSSNCFFGYLESGAAEDKPRLCFVHTLKPVEDSFGSPDAQQVGSLYNMSSNDITDACGSAFYSPTFSDRNQIWYPNPFCLIYKEGEPNSLECYVKSGTSNKADYLALLDPRVKEILDGNEKLTYIATACAGGDLSLNRPSLCRKITCPVGQIRNRDGQCMFISNRVFYKGRTRYSANILLRPVTHEIFVDTENITVNKIAEAFGTLSGWEIVFYGIATDLMTNSTRKRGDLLVRMSVGSSDITIELESIKPLFGRLVTLNDGTFDHIFSVGHYPLNLPFGPDGNNTDYTKKFCSKENAKIWNDLAEFSICWHLLFDESSLTYRSTTFNKMFFCNLVELLPEDFRTLANDTIIYYEIGKRYLYETEFFTIEDENGNRRAKICLEDTGLTPSAENAGVKFVGYILMVIAILLPSL